MPTKLQDHTVMPPDETEPLTKMAAAMRGGNATLTGPDGAAWQLPTEVYNILREVLEAMAQGLAISVMPRHTMLTTQEAADVLGISRPTLVRLLETDQLPHERRGRHRRVRLTDLLAYRDRARSERDRHLDAMVSEAGDLDLYRDTAEPRPTR